MSRLRQLTRHVILFAWLESWYNNVFHRTFENGLHILFELSREGAVESLSRIALSF